MEDDDMTLPLPVDYSDNRYGRLVDWLANEHTVLSQALRREPTDEEHRRTLTPSST